MTANYINVITIKNGVVDGNTLFVGENNIILSGVNAGKNIVEVAEAFFLQECKRLNPAFNPTEDEKDAILEDGYYDLGEQPELHTDGAVCITWPL